MRLRYGRFNGLWPDKEEREDGRAPCDNEEECAYPYHGTSDHEEGCPEYGNKDDEIEDDPGTMLGAVCEREDRDEDGSDCKEHAHLHHLAFVHQERCPEEGHKEHEEKKDPCPRFWNFANSMHTLPTSHHKYKYCSIIGAGLSCTSEILTDNPHRHLFQDLAGNTFGGCLVRTPLCIPACTSPW